MEFLLSTRNDPMRLMEVSSDIPKKHGAVSRYPCGKEVSEPGPVRFHTRY